MTESYRQRFIAPGSGRLYDVNEYSPREQGATLWRLEQGILDGFVKELPQRPIRHLDFACGTGRILAWGATRGFESTGVDISPAMLEVAGERVPGARLIEVDLTREPAALGSARFELVTAFRFLLNAEPALRREALGQLREALADDGLLVVNNHVALPSYKSLSRVWRSLRSVLSLDSALKKTDLRRTLRDAGFEIIRERALGLIPGRAFRTPLARPCALVEAAAFHAGLTRRFGVDQIVLCRRSP